MQQFDLFKEKIESHKNKKVLMVDTVPKNARNTGTINLGLEIVVDKLDADVMFWYDDIDSIDKYELIAFNVFYPMNILNIAPFFKKNNLSLTKEGRGVKTIVGGAGIGDNGILNNIIDETFVGEYDESENMVEITTRPYIKNNKAVIELTRGCRHRCHFCEYIWSKPSNRQKPIQLVKDQIDEVTGMGIRNINFMSANFTGYRHLEELAEYTTKKGVVIKNTDITIMDAKNIYPILDKMPKYLKMGIESFDEKTRMKVGKKFNDEQLLETIKKLLEHCNGLHFYLIYGMPGDDYSSWFKWLEVLGKLRKSYRKKEYNLFNPEGELVNTKNIRFEFAITNFEPPYGTPLQDAPQIDFKEKAKFLKKWFKALVDNGFASDKNVEEMDYKNARGRIGRKQLSYEMLMTLKSGGEELTDSLIYALPNGVGRSISDKEADTFLNHCK